MRTRRLTRETVVPRPLDEVFEFFADARNLERLTPPWLSFEIVTPTPLTMEVGALIDYRIRARGLRMIWRSRIAVWEPPHRFVDEQLRGPYRRWWHEHTFEVVDGGTRIRDVVDYAVPGWFLEPVVHRLLFGPDLERIFDYRETRQRALFGSQPTGAQPDAAPRNAHRSS